MNVIHQELFRDPCLNQNQLQFLLNKLYLSSKSLPVVLENLFFQQKSSGFISKETLLYIDNYQTIELPNNFLNIQCNPARQNRGVSDKPNYNPVNIIPFHGGIPCFCCWENINQQWPRERGFEFKITSEGIQQKEFIFLPNPFPIFHFHFTIALQEHLYNDMDIETVLKLARMLSEKWWVIQNAADAGATNPWHLHLQTFKADLPISVLKPRKTIISNEDLHLARLEHGASLYKFTIPLDSRFGFKQLKKIQDQFLKADKDNRLNYLAQFKGNKYHVYIVLRNKRFRTSMFSEVQPGYAEISGFITTFTKKNYEEWLLNANELYSGLMQEIQVAPEIEYFFETLIKN